MKFISVAFLAFLFCSCSTSEKKRINDEVLNENQVTDGPTLNQSVHQLIDNSKGLTSEQKNLLTGIIDDIRTKNKSLTEESFKYRSVLMKEIISGEGGRRQIRMIEKQIAKVERERLKNTIKGAEQIASIVKGQKEQEQIMDHLMMREVNSRF